MPDWVPAATTRYLAHTEAGLPIRELARHAGCHASTVLRQIRRMESRREDTLVDEALRHLGKSVFRPCRQESERDCRLMNAQNMPTDLPPDEETLRAEAMRILRRLTERGAILAVAADLDKAVVVRDAPDGSSRSAVVARNVAQAMALKDWITCEAPGRVSRYAITAAGRAALSEMLGKSSNAQPGFAEAQAGFAGQHRIWDERVVADGNARQRRIRYNAAESPLTALARRKDRDGKPFLSFELVAAGERLREDFELAQMGPRVTQNWDRFLTGSERGSFAGSKSGMRGSEAARDRVATALAALGPGLGDVALRCCCYLEGLETAEKRMGWSARSGKIVLRIALQRLKAHYDRRDPGDALIG
ncbi:helix-turn-helix domain-containing protein [Lutimaribacter sp. EGI FJ00015]|nr:helix-turn-helix domain-containing protein [Lutimaribacter sp. EGI FJ00015]